ncbi:PEGA domain-containing protein [Candidatus Magnetomorum sp. HK-1]|nr:PEGA domain-containing protein [Candidatus Magnetomorum sp. HK-1]
MLEIRSERNIRFWVKSNQDCFIKVLYISKSGEEYMLFPNAHDKINFLKAGIQKTVGERNDLKVIQPLGLDTVTVVASKVQFSNIQEQLIMTNEIYYTQHLKSPLHGVHTRAIGVVEKQNFQAYATDTCYIVSHEEK